MMTRRNQFRPRPLLFSDLTVPSPPQSRASRCPRPPARRRRRRRPTTPPPASLSPATPGVFLAVVVALVSVAVSWLDLARETTLGIDLGTTHSVAATCDKGVVSVVRVDGGVRADGGWDDGDDDDGFGGFGGGLTLPSVVRFERRRRRRRRKETTTTTTTMTRTTSSPSARPPRARGPSRRLASCTTRSGVIGRAWADPVVREEADAMPFRVVKRRGNGDDLDDLDDGRRVRR